MLSNLSNFPLSSATSLQTGMGSFSLRYCISSIFFLSRFHGKILILRTLLRIRAGSDVAMGCVAGLVLCYYRIRGSLYCTVPHHGDLEPLDARKYGISNINHLATAINVRRSIQHSYIEHSQFPSDLLLA